jgi:hypothetical protein
MDQTIKVLLDSIGFIPRYKALSGADGKNEKNFLRGSIEDI